MESLSHTPFIAAAYVIFFLVLGGLAALFTLRARAAKAEAERLEAANPRRRRDRA